MPTSYKLSDYVRGKEEVLTCSCERRIESQKKFINGNKVCRIKMIVPEYGRILYIPMFKVSPEMQVDSMVLALHLSVCYLSNN